MTFHQPSLTSVTRAAFVALMLCTALSGCGQVRRALGYDKAPPDEFTVVARAPLSQPPDYTLHPPTPGAPRPQEGSQREQAKAILFSGSANASQTDAALYAGTSPGEQALLKRAGADKALPGIRKKVDEESTALVETDKSFSDEILFWQSKDQPGTEVDAAKESERLRKDRALGKPVTDGATPQITRKKKAWLEDLF